MTFAFLAEAPEIQKLKSKSCESFLINIMLEFTNSTPRRCQKAYDESFYDRTETRTGKCLNFFYFHLMIDNIANLLQLNQMVQMQKTFPVLFSTFYNFLFIIIARGEFERRTNSCRVSLGAWEYNLLSTWVEAYSKEKIPTSYEENSIIVNLGAANEFTWCGPSKQKMSMTFRNEERKYCKQITDWDFNPLNSGKVRIDLEAFTDCNDNKISEDGSVHWIMNFDEEKKGTTGNVVPVNTEMKYKIESPLTTTIGILEKETKIEGCQHRHRGCDIILRFAEGTIFHRERINKSIDKIVIDLGAEQGQ